MRPWSSYRALSVSLLVASGCITLEDIPLPKDAGALSSEEDAETGSDSDAEPDLRDAEVDTGSAPKVDSGSVLVPDGWDAGVDVGSVPRDSGSAPPLRTCGASEDCEEDEYCSASRASRDAPPRSVCRPKCADDTCAVIFTDFTKQNLAVMRAESDALYWATHPTTDSLGNPRRDGELWRMTSGQAPQRLTDQLSEESQFVIHQGYAYYRSRHQLSRVPVDLSSAAQLLYGLPAGDSVHWTVGGSTIVFATYMGLTVGSLDGSAPLKSIYGGMTDRKAWVVDDRIYFVAITDSVWSFKSIRLAEPYTVEDTLFPNVLAAMVTYVRAPYVYTYGPRIDLRDGRSETVVGAAKLGDPSSSLYSVEGDWAYRYASEGGRDWLGRWSLLSLGVGQELVPEGEHVWYSESGGAERGLFGALFAVYGDSLYIANPGGRVIHQRPLPAQPCDANLPCPTGKTCGADALCH